MQMKTGVVCLSSMSNIMVDDEMVGRRVYQMNQYKFGYIVGFDQYGYKVVFDDYSQCASQSFDSRSPFTKIRLVDDCERPKIGSEEVKFLIDAALVKRNNDKADQEKAYSDKQARIAAAADKLRAEAKIKISMKGDRPIPSANLKKMLKMEVPEADVRVSADGCRAIRVSVMNSDQLSPEQMKKISALSDKFQCGTFNGMEDIYEYDDSVDQKAFGIVYGDAQYVFVNRRDGCLV